MRWVAYRFPDIRLSCRAAPSPRIWRVMPSTSGSSRSSANRPFPWCGKPGAGSCRRHPADVGTLARIRSGEIAVHPGIERLTAQGARFVDGTEAAFDTLIVATGHRSNIQAMFPQNQVDVDRHGLRTAVVGSGAPAGVHVVGFDTCQPGGLLLTIGRQAKLVADAIGAGAPIAA